MADDIRIDAHEVEQLARDLGKVSGRLVPAVEAVVKRGATNVRKDWRQRWRGLSHLPRLASTVTFDMKHGVGLIGAEIGPDPGKPQGNLAHIAEHGTIKNAAHPGGSPALAAEEPKFVKALGDVAGKVLE